MAFAATAAGLLALMACSTFSAPSSRAGSPIAATRTLLFRYYGLRGLSLVYLPFSGFDAVPLAVFAVFYGLDWVATVRRR